VHRRGGRGKIRYGPHTSLISHKGGGGKSASETAEGNGKVPCPEPFVRDSASLIPPLSPFAALSSAESLKIAGGEGNGMIPWTTVNKGQTQAGYRRGRLRKDFFSLSRATFLKSSKREKEVVGEELNKKGDYRGNPKCRTGKRASRSHFIRKGSLGKVGKGEWDNLLIKVAASIPRGETGENKTREIAGEAPEPLRERGKVKNVQVKKTRRVEKGGDTPLGYTGASKAERDPGSIEARSPEPGRDEAPR